MSIFNFSIFLHAVVVYVLHFHNAYIFICGLFISFLTTKLWFFTKSKVNRKHSKIIVYLEVLLVCLSSFKFIVLILKEIKEQNDVSFMEVVFESSQ